MQGIEDDIENVAEHAQGFVERRGGGRKSVVASVVVLLVFIAGTNGWDVLVPNDVKDQIAEAISTHEEEPCHGEACDRLDGLRGDLNTLVQTTQTIADNQIEFQAQQQETNEIVKSYAESNTISIEMIRSELDESRRRDAESELRTERRELIIEREALLVEIARIQGNDREPTPTHRNRLSAINNRILELDDELEML